MNINPLFFNHMVKSGASAVQKTAGAAEAAMGGQPSQQIQDTITISREGSSQNLFSGLSRRIAGEIAQLDHPARVEALREAVSAGSYYVPAAAVADAMLGLQTEF